MQPMIVSQAAQDRLLEKQWTARVWMNQNPFARAANCQVRIRMRNRLQRKMESKVLVFDSDSNP